MQHPVALVLYHRNEVEKFVLECFELIHFSLGFFVTSDPRGVGTSFMHQYVTMAYSHPLAVEKSNFTQ